MKDPSRAMGTIAGTISEYHCACALGGLLAPEVYRRLKVGPVRVLRESIRRGAKYDEDITA